MIKSSLVFLVFLILVTSSPSVFAETGEYLRSVCRPLSTVATDSEGHFQMPDESSGFCWGFFGAIQAVTGIVDSSTDKRLFGVCWPDDVKRLQLIAVFEKYADSHPENMNEDASLFALDALRNAWPCKPQPKKR